MPRRSDICEVITRVAKGVHPPLIAIDGLPCSGKSTLVENLQAHVDLDCIYLDEFVLPQAEWPADIRPSFPFQFIQYDAFLNTVKTLAVAGRCSYQPFDWNTLSTSANWRNIALTKPVIVEGVSSLHPELSSLYGLRIFVESDRGTVLATALSRGVGPWEKEWRELFLPSVDIYMRTHPERRADLLVPGRGWLPGS